jgi:hypothetical protein
MHFLEFTGSHIISRRKLHLRYTIHRGKKFTDFASSVGYSNIRALNSGNYFG